MRSGLVLVVDDDYDIRESLSEIIREAGFSVATAENGRAALDQLKAGVRPALILLDLMMPVMDGTAFRSLQLADPALETIPVVTITAAGRRAVAGLAPETVLHKPLRMQQVIQVVERYCGPSSLAQT